MVVAQYILLLNKETFMIHMLILLNCFSFGVNKDTGILTTTSNPDTDTSSLPGKMEPLTTYEPAKVIAPEKGYKTTKVVKRRTDDIYRTMLVIPEDGFKTTTIPQQKVTFNAKFDLDIPPDTGFKTTTERAIPVTLGLILPDDGFKTTRPGPEPRPTEIGHAIAFSDFVTTTPQGFQNAYYSYDGGLSKFLTTGFIASAPVSPFSSPFAQNSNGDSYVNISVQNSAMFDSFFSLSNSGTTLFNVSPSPTVQTSGLQHKQLGSLLDAVLDQYDRRMRPRNDQLRFVTIFSDFVPHSIIEFNTQEQKFSVMGYFKMDWRDDFLTWDPTMYEGTETLRIPVESIWIPKLSIDKAYNGNGLVGDIDTDIAVINYKGYVRWFPEGIYSVPCRVTIRFYPFDVQTCTLSYKIADEDNSTINLQHDGQVDQSEYIENAEWKLVNLSAERKHEDNIYVVNFYFSVERRGGFTMFTLVVPVLMLSLLSGATFLIPVESGEKCSFSVTIFLAYGIFETIVIDTLPHNSLDLSYFIIYLTSQLIVSVLLTFYTILQTKIFTAIGHKVFKTSRQGSDVTIVTWGTFLQKLDTYIFVVFLVLVIGCTSTFLSVMMEKFDFL